MMIRPCADLQSVIDQDGAVILNEARCQITTLDAMGGYIWRQLESGIRREEIVRHLVEKTGEVSDVVMRDVREFLADLASRSLITMSAEHSEPEVNG